MEKVLPQALSFILIIFIAYRLKRCGFFAEHDYRLVSKIVVYMTLPCAVISSFEHFEMDYGLFLAVAVGLLGNLIMVMGAFLLTRRETPAAKIFYVFSMSGYNIGNFTLPFVQSFLGPFGVIALCMFDVGNSIMCTGLTYAIAASCIGTADGVKEPITARNVISKLTHSVPFMVYLTMLVLALLNVRLPAPVYMFTNLVGHANTFLSMFMIGMMFELRFDKRSLGYVGEIVFSRYAAGLAFAAFFLFLSPLSRDVNLVLAAALLAPSTAIGPIFIEKMGGNVTLASVVNSVTISCSVVLFILFFTALHI